MGTVSVNVPGPGTYQVKCDPNLDPLPDGGTAADVLEGKQFYRPDSSVVTGSMPDNTPEDVELEPGESYDIPRGYHSGAGRVAARALTIDPAPVQGSGNPVASGGVYDALEGKQNKLTGAPGQVVGFNADGNAVAQEAPDTGVTAFHGRTGAVQPMSGDYTAEMVGARPDTWTPTAAQVGAVPTSRKVNGKALSADISISAADVGAPTVAEMNAAIQAAAPAEGVTSFNGRKGAVTPASGDYTAADVGALSLSGGTLDGNLTLNGNKSLIFKNAANASVALATTAGGTLKLTARGINLITSKGTTNVDNLVLSTRKVNEKALSSDITLSANDIGVTPPAGMSATNMQNAVSELFTSVSDGKAAIASAITDKGVSTSSTAAFSTMASNIRNIPSGYKKPGVPLRLTVTWDSTLQYLYIAYLKITDDGSIYLETYSNANGIEYTVNTITSSTIVLVSYKDIPITATPNTPGIFKVMNRFGHSGIICSVMYGVLSGDPRELTVHIGPQ